MLFNMNWIIYCLIGCVLFKLFESLLLSKKRNGIDSLPGPLSLPLVGAMYLFIFSKKPPLAVITDEAVKYPLMKTPIKFNLGPYLTIGIARPEDIQRVLSSPNALSKAILYTFSKVFFGNGLLVAPVDIWKKHRKIINVSFHQSILNSSVSTFEKHSNILVDRLREKVGEPEFHIIHLIAQCTLDMICDTVIGSTFTRESNDMGILPFLSAVGKLMKAVNKRMFSVWLYPDFIYRISGKEQQELKYKKITMSYSEKIVGEKLRTYNARDQNKIEEEEINRRNILDLIIDLTQQNDDEHKWTSEELRDEVNTLLAAGSETTASTNSFVLMMLGIYPKVQEKVMEELKGIFGDSKRSIQLEDLTKMEYLERVIKETLRIFPSAPLIARETTGNVKLDSCTLPKGTMVVIYIRIVHMDPGIWGENVNEFEPDRFLPERSIGRHPFAYIPFSGGPRNCIGSRYAMMAMKCLLATVLRNFIVLCSRKMEDIDIRTDVTLKPVKGYMVSFLDRAPVI